MTGSAYGLALITIVGQCMGAGDIEAAKRETAKIMKITWISILIISGFVFIFRHYLTGFFNLSPDARASASLFLRIQCISMIAFWAFSFTLPCALRAAGDSRYVMVVAAASMWIVRVCAAYLFCFALGLGPIGVFLAMGGDFLARGICYFLRWRSGRWQKMKVIDR